MSSSRDPGRPAVVLPGRPARRAETSQTLDRGLNVLRVLADAEHGRSVGELAGELGVNRTVVYRLLATLEQHRLARRGPDGRYRLGLGLIRLAGRARPMLSDAAVPVLRELTQATGATSHLTVADGEDGLVVAVEEPAWSDVHVSYRVGLRRPLEESAAGAAILGARTAGPGRRPAPGYLLRDELPGLRGLAAAVVGVGGVEAALGVVALDAAPPSRIGADVVAAADRLGAALR